MPGAVNLKQLGALLVIHAADSERSDKLSKVNHNSTVLANWVQDGASQESQTVAKIIEDAVQSSLGWKTWPVRLIES